MSRTIQARMCLTALAFGGIVLGHEIGYVAAAPSSVHRAHLLAETGHNHWTVLVACAVAASAAALARFVTDAAREARRGPSIGVPASVARLAGLQAAGFLALESIERPMSHGGLGHLVHEPAVVIGVVAQVFVALAGAWLLRLLGAAVNPLVARRGLPAGRAGSVPAFTHLLFPSSSTIANSLSPRGPRGAGLGGARHSTGS